MTDVPCPYSQRCHQLETELSSVSDERDALRIECDDLRRDLDSFRDSLEFCERVGAVVTKGHACQPGVMWSVFDARGNKGYGETLPLAVAAYQKAVSG